MQKPVVPAPTSVAEVEELVRCLYQPGNANVIAAIQEQLQILQRSPEGWQLADVLLASGDDKVRFFGALTLTVKLNLDWETLDSGALQQLHSRLLKWLVQLVSQGEGPLVTKKLCSTLVTFFLRPNVTWTRCIRHIICVLGTGDAILEEDLDNFPPNTDLLRNFNLLQIKACLWFCSILVEEVDKTEVDSQQHQRYYQRLDANANDAITLIQFALGYTGDGHSAIHEHGMACFASWALHAQKSWPKDTERLTQLRSIIEPAMNCCAQGDEEAIETLIDLLGNYTSFFLPEHFDALSSLLRSEWGRNQLASMTLGESTGMQFGRLLLAYGEATVQNIAMNHTSISSKEILDMMHQLLRMPGYAVDEDQMCIHALDFWNTFVEFVTDSIYGAEEQEWMSSAKTHMMQTIEECWVKLRLPPADISAQWDSDTKKEFGAFRADVKDMYQSAHILLGHDMVERLTTLAILSIQDRAWWEVEASVFSLNALADTLADQETEDTLLAQVLGSPLFSDLSAAGSAIPAKVHRTAVDLLGHYADFFVRHTEYLPAALNFLFSSLAAAALANTAARSISSLCSSCRKSLGSELDAFLQQYENFITWPTADTFTKEKVIGAIAAIIQALPSEALKIDPLGKLLDYIEKDISKSLQCVAAGALEEGQVWGVTALQCLASIGRASQTLEEVAVELEPEETRTDYWSQGAGVAMQQRIIQCIEGLTAVFSKDGDTIEAACNVLRSGFTETTPGPFVLPPRVTVDLLSRCTLDTPRVETVLSTTSVLLRMHTPDYSPRIQEEAVAIFQHILILIEGLVIPGRDPDIAQNCIDVVARLMPRYVNVLFEPQSGAALEKFLSFSIQSFNGDDVLPKRSSSSFWASLVSLTLEDASLQHAVNMVIAHFGPMLADALIRNVGGAAARSDLDFIADPLKKLITRQPETKTWLENALMSPEFPSQKVGVPEKKKFLLQMMSARGSRATNTIIKEFWISCRGTINYG